MEADDGSPLGSTLSSPVHYVPRGRDSPRVLADDGSLGSTFSFDGSSLSSLFDSPLGSPAAPPHDETEQVSDHQTSEPRRVTTLSPRRRSITGGHTHSLDWNPPGDLENPRTPGTPGTPDTPGTPSTPGTGTSKTSRFSHSSSPLNPSIKRL
ncbi:uncharacterized protein LOC125302185 isoform X2 [Alosa alosa]|uniref:uncharacterized protein LOC125302185 isoform X2 n=1 Tax=Alosa alosa TaxID=278164 RepID=UPI00201523C1|nr:uncharacterized protein LOC125302185 isoform X2 [Alosa alosa]